jgi:predicted GNAT family acetyltransferase
MGWTLSESVDEFLEAAGAMLEANPAENTVLLTVSARVAEAGPNALGPEPARFGWWRDDERSPVAGAVLVTPPYPLRLSLMPDLAAAELVAALPTWSGEVSGKTAIVSAFVDAWVARTGGTATIRLEQALYRLGELVPPNVPGHARHAVAADRTLLVAWFLSFADELRIPHGNPESWVDSRLVSGSIQIWEDGEPVSIAGRSAVIAEMARIGPVYTPPRWRGRGYGSAVTAAATADALARGAGQVVLFTDLANPTSNSIYRKIGYRPIGDEVIVDLRR